eukprot:gene3822-17628_t
MKDRLEEDEREREKKEEKAVGRREHGGGERRTVARPFFEAGCLRCVASSGDCDTSDLSLAAGGAAATVFHTGVALSVVNAPTADTRELLAVPSPRVRGGRGGPAQGVFVLQQKSAAARAPAGKAPPRPPAPLRLVWTLDDRVGAPGDDVVERNWKRFAVRFFVCLTIWTAPGWFENTLRA